MDLISHIEWKYGKENKEHFYICLRSRPGSPNVVRVSVSQSVSDNVENDARRTQKTQMTQMTQMTE